MIQIKPQHLTFWHGGRVQWSFPCTVDHLSHLTVATHQMTLKISTLVLKLGANQATRVMSSLDDEIGSSSTIGSSSSSKSIRTGMWRGLACTGRATYGTGGSFLKTLTLSYTRQQACINTSWSKHECKTKPVKVQLTCNGGLLAR